MIHRVHCIYTRSIEGHQEGLSASKGGCVLRDGARTLKISYKLLLLKHVWENPASDGAEVPANHHPAQLDDKMKKT